MSAYLRASQHRYSDGVRAIRIRFGVFRLTGSVGIWLGWRRSGGRR